MLEDTPVKSASNQLEIWDQRLEKWIGLRSQKFGSFLQRSLLIWIKYDNRTLVRKDLWRERWKNC